MYFGLVLVWKRHIFLPENPFSFKITELCDTLEKTNQKEGHAKMWGRQPQSPNGTKTRKGQKREEKEPERESPARPRMRLSEGQRVRDV